jgi:hypothetical protein
MKKKNNELSEMFDRLIISPCKTCYKRDSCFIKPINGICVGYEAGTPWSEIYTKMEDLNRTSAFHKIRELD